MFYSNSAVLRSGASMLAGVKYVLGVTSNFTIHVSCLYFSVAR